MVLMYTYCIYFIWLIGCPSKSMNLVLYQAFGLKQGGKNKILGGEGGGHVKFVHPYLCNIINTKYDIEKIYTSPKSLIFL